MPELSRRIDLPLLVLYGLGTTVGAGIYALLGDIARTAGLFAPWSFVLASLLAALSALSFAELSNRYPRAGATALYVERGFGSRHFALLVGLLLVASAVSSGAALVNGIVGYAQVFAPLSRELVIVGTLLLVSAVSLWGIAQSAWMAGVISVLEVGGVLWMAALAGSNIEISTVDWSSLIPDGGHLPAIFAGAVLSFYAYIGFEDMVEVAEEVKNVRSTLPRAILITLVVTSVLYVLLMLTTQLAVGTDFLERSNAPFADIYRELTGAEPVVFMLIGLLAILNGVLIQIVMASRVLYGLASRKALPAVFARVSTRTHTPVVATLAVGAAVLGLALAGSLGGLAKGTSLIMLIVFGLANTALFLIKWREPIQAAAQQQFRVPVLIPLAGAIVCFLFVVRSLSEQI